MPHLTLEMEAFSTGTGMGKLVELDPIFLGLSAMIQLYNFVNNLVRNGISKPLQLPRMLHLSLDQVYLARQRRASHGGAENYRFRDRSGDGN